MTTKERKALLDSLTDDELMAIAKKAKAKEPVNVVHKVKDNRLTITVETTQDHGTSRSGRSNIVATTKGEINLGDGLYMNVNVYRKAS